MNRLRWALPCWLLVCACDSFNSEEPPAPVVLPGIDWSNDAPPEPTTAPIEQPETPPASLVDRAREVLPERPSTTLGEFELDGIVVRATECYLLGGCTLELLILSLDEDRVTGVDPTTNLDGRLEPSIVLAQDLCLRGRSEIASTPIHLPANVPVPVTIFWDGPLRKPEIIEFRFHHSDESATLGGYRAYATTPDWDGWPRMESADIDAGLGLLARCDAAVPGTVHWGHGAYSSSVGIEFNALPGATGAFTGQFFVWDEKGVKRTKSFTGQLRRDDEAGGVECVIETTRGSGSSGRPTPAVSVENLLMRGSSVTINLRLYGHQLLGGTEEGVQFRINGAPYPAPEVEAAEQTSATG